MARPRKTPEDTQEDTIIDTDEVSPKETPEVATLPIDMRPKGVPYSIPGKTLKRVDY